MSNIDKQALRDEVQEWKDIYCEPADAENLQFFLGVEALLDDLEAKDKRIAELSQKADIYDMLRQDYELHGSLVDFVDWQTKRIAELEAREINLPPYSFFDFKLGSPFKSGAYCHIDSLNTELSKHGIKMIAAAGKGEAS